MCILNDGQAFNLKNTSKSLVEYSPGTRTGRRYLFVHTLPHTRVPVPQRKEFLQAPHALIFAANVQSTPIHCLALEGRKAYVPGSHENVTIKETVFGRLPPSRPCRRKLKPSVCLYEVCMLRNFDLRVRPLVLHTSNGLRGVFREQRQVDTILALFHCLCPASWYLPKRSSYLCFRPKFLQLLPGKPLHDLVLVYVVAYTHRSHRTIIYTKIIFKQTQEVNLSMKKTY